MPDASKSSAQSQQPRMFEGFCPVSPVPQGRPRFTFRNGHVITFTPKETEQYVKSVRAYLKREYGAMPPMDGPLRVDYEFIMPKPKSVPKSRRLVQTKPDLDNLVKSFQDALEYKQMRNENSEFGLIAGDSRIASSNAIKRYAMDGETCGTKYRIMCAIDTVVVSDNGVSKDMLGIIDRNLPVYDATLLKGERPNRDVRYVYLLCSSEAAVQYALPTIEQKFPCCDKVMVL